MYVRTFFEQSSKTMSPAIRQVIMEDVESLLNGKRGEFFEHRRDLGDDFLTVCDQCGVHLSFPIRQ